MKPEKKSGKAPKIFRKPVSVEVWDKRFLKKLYLPADREFLVSVAAEENGLVGIRWNELSSDETKRLKQLGKVIAKNRRSVSFILIFIIIILAAAAVFFQFYLKNRLVRNLVETGLERVFLAKVDAFDSRLSILNGDFSIGRLVIADAGRPMQNLVELSSVSAKLDAAALLQGRIYIEELGFSGMKRGTPRSVSGILETEPAPADSDSKAGTASGSVATEDEDLVSGIASKISALAGAVDPAALIEQQRENLSSLAVIEDSKQELEGYAVQWQDRADEWKLRMTGWQDSAAWVSGLNTASFSSIESAGTSVSRLQEIYGRAEGDIASMEEDFASLEQQTSSVSSIAGRINDAVSADFAYLESLVSLPESGAAGWAASIIEDQLGVPLGGYLSKLETGLEWYGRFTRLMEKRGKLRPGARRSGRHLPPPADAPPGFILVRAYGSGQEEDLAYSFELTDLASEPEKWSSPAALSLSVSTPVTGRAEAVLSSESLSLAVPEAVFDLGAALKDLDIEDLSGALSLEADAGWNDDGMNGRVSLALPEIAIKEAKPDSLLYLIISRSLAAANPLAAAGSFAVNPAGELSLSLDTDIDERMTEILGDLISESADEGIAMLRGMLEKELSGPLADVEAARGEFESYAERIEDYRSELEKVRSQAEEKISELEAAVEKEARKQAEDLIKSAVPDEAEAQIKDAGEAIKQGLGGMLNF